MSSNELVRFCSCRRCCCWRIALILLQHPYVPPPFGGDPNRSQFADAQDDDDDTGVAAVRQIKMEDDAGSERPESTCRPLRACVTHAWQAPSDG